MNATLAVLGFLVVGLVIWLLLRHRQGEAGHAVAERDRILRELRELESKRQGLIGEATQRGVTISTDRALKQVEELRESYARSGKEDSAREVERIIREFREQNGSEISIEKAYALMKELEGKHGRS